MTREILANTCHGLCISWQSRPGHFSQYSQGSATNIDCEPLIGSSDKLTSFQGANKVSILGGKGLLPNWSVAAPPPLTMKSNQPSSLVMVYPSLRWSDLQCLVNTRWWHDTWHMTHLVILTPTSPRPDTDTTWPLITATRLKIVRIELCKYHWRKSEIVIMWELN